VSSIGTVVASGGAGCLAVSFDVGSRENEFEGSKGLVMVVSLAPVATCIDEKTCCFDVFKSRADGCFVSDGVVPVRGKSLAFLDLLE
jgi:hypothetical protein